ncbi:MAG: sulfatase family protein, partial [Flavobacteriales bacterium]
QYKLMAANLDKNIGRLLDQAGPSTVVCVVGDNGTPIPATAPAQDPSKVKTTTFEDGIRVPMIWYGPGITHGETDALASLADILPTMAEALSCATVAGTDGVSLLPVLFGVSTGVRWSVWSGAERFDDYALVSDRWKYREVGLSPELYDLDADPLETVNLYGTQPQVEAVMAAELLAHK